MKFGCVSASFAETKRVITLIWVLIGWANSAFVASETTLLQGLVYHWASHAVLENAEITRGEGEGAIVVSTRANGRYVFEQTDVRDLTLSGYVALAPRDVNRTITSADALAALKIAVGLNPNIDSDGNGPLTALPVSPYQLVAADVNGDGRVTSADALAILKMAVGLDSALTPSWALVADSQNVWATHNDRTTVFGHSAGYTLSYPEQAEVNFAAILKGDVNGSWTALEDSEILSEAYFSTRVKESAAPLSLWAIRDTDSDGLSDDQELALGTFIDKVDSDGDGVPDNRDSDPLGIGNDSDGDGVADGLDALPNDPANFTDSDGDGVYDFYDVDPADANKSKTVVFDFALANATGVSESLNQTTPDVAGTFSIKNWFVATWDKYLDAFFVSNVVAQNDGADNDTLVEKTNLITWGTDGAVVSDVIQSDQSMFVSESVLTPDGRYLYLFTSPNMQRVLNDSGKISLDVDDCQLYKVTLDTNKFTCVLDENDPRLRSRLLISAKRDDYLSAAIDFRADGTGVLQSLEGPMVLFPDGTYKLFNSTNRMPPNGYAKSIEFIAWVDDEHVAINASIYPEAGGLSASYWSAFNLASGEEVDEIEGNANQVVMNDGAIMTQSNRFRWNGSTFVSEQSQLVVQDSFGNLWFQEGVAGIDGKGLSLVDRQRGLSVRVGDKRTGPDDLMMRSGTGTNIIYREYAFADDWVLTKYGLEPRDEIVTLEGVDYVSSALMYDDSMHIALENGASFIKLRDPNLWYYLRSGTETADVVINYRVQTASGAIEPRTYTIPIDAINSFAAFDPTVYDVSGYASGFQLLEEKGEGVALELPNPEGERLTFCLYQISTFQQRCAELADYQVKRMDYERLYNNSERHFPSSFYACPNNSCNAYPGVQNIVFGGTGLIAYFKDSADNQYYKAEAGLADFMLNGDAALEITPVINGAGESEIIAQTTAIKAAQQRTLEGITATYNAATVVIDFGVKMSAYASIPVITLDNESTRVVFETDSGVWNDTHTQLTLNIRNSGALTAGDYRVTFVDWLFVKDSALRYQPNEAVVLTLTQSLIDNSPDLAPVFTSGATFSTPENQLAIGIVTASDADSAAVTFSVSGNEFAITSSGILSFVAAPDFETKSSYTATLTASDGTNAVTQAITVTVTDVDEAAPVFTSGIAFTVNENQTAITTITATDENSTEVTFIVSGTELAITSAGVLSFVAAPDFETKSSYTATLTASDGTNTVTQDITVTVTDVVEAAPVFTSDELYTVPENQRLIGIVNVTDADSESIELTISGSDMTISPEGVLSFVTAPDYEIQTAYTTVITASDGVYTTNHTVVVKVTDLDESGANLTLSGKAIDGYLAGALVVIDQNYNLAFDAGEFASFTDAEGRFEINTGSDMSLYACLEQRPIVAIVPVGAVDATLGEVTQAYKMVLPSVKDAGSSSVVISPFTTLFTEAIVEGKSSLSEDLSVNEGCGEKGDSVSSAVSATINALKTSIETNFNIESDRLFADFIFNSTAQVNESIAQNIAKLFPYTKTIDDEISQYLTDRFSKPIRTNISLSKDSLEIIFGGEAYEKLPLSFASRYATEPNPFGWMQLESIESSNAFLSKSGVLSREDCSSTDTELCDITDFSLEAVANAATHYSRKSSFYNSAISVDNLSGNITVTAEDARTWRNNSSTWQQAGSRDRECIKQETISFRVDDTVNLSEFYFSGYSQGYEQANCSLARHYYYPRIGVHTFPHATDGSVAFNYYVPDILRTGILSKVPADFIKNQLTINPSTVIEEMSKLPKFFKDLNVARRLFNNDDYVLIQLYDGAQESDVHYFEAGTSPRNDWYGLMTGGGFTVNRYGQGARDMFFEALKNNPHFDETHYGSAAPKSSVLGRIAKPYIEFVDYQNDTGAPILYPIYPTYDKNSKTLDVSLKGAEIDLENIKEFIQKGLNDRPLMINVAVNPDDSISGTMPLELYLFKGQDEQLSPGETFFKLSFNLDVEADAAGLLVNLNADETIVAEYSNGNFVISTELKNTELDRIFIEDGLQEKPSNVALKVLRLLGSVQDEIGSLQDFFEHDAFYYFKVDLGDGAFSINDYDRNTVDKIVGSFKVSSSPTNGIFVQDVELNEGESKEICFTRPAAGTLGETRFALSFTERDRPGRGGLASDFSLSSTEIVFSDTDTRQCTTITAHLDTAFDWVQEIFLDVGTPTNGVLLSRDQLRVRVFDPRWDNRIGSTDD